MKKVLLRIAIISLALVFVSTIGFAVEKKVPAKPAEAKAVEKKAEEGKGELVDINAASKEQLMKLTGIGDSYAQKIIAGRPYAKKDQLKSKKIIPAETYEKIKDKIIAKQTPKKK